jgi:hypothetical protein
MGGDRNARVERRVFHRLPLWSSAVQPLEYHIVFWLVRP